MALTRHKSHFQLRPANKEPEWSSICNNVFNQYLDDGDLFGLGVESRERSSSDDSLNLFDFSEASERSNQTDGTSPIPAWSPEKSSAPLARQPLAKAPTEFWHQKLRALEQNAADCEQRQHRLRVAKSHPDFLSLGGFPSPPAVPSSPTELSYSAQRQRGRAAGSAANGTKTPTKRSITNLRAVSRGRPTGVTKVPTSAAANPGGTNRKQRDVSPSKMMTPSRYRAGFKDVWAARTQSSPRKFELRLASGGNSFPASPPPSARADQDSFAAFGSPTFGYDEQISPLAKTFQQSARIHTPVESPLFEPEDPLPSSYIALPPPPLHINQYAAHTVPLNDTAPLYTERDANLAVNKIDEFEFGFSSSPDLEQWSGAPFAEPGFNLHDPFGHNEDPFQSLHGNYLANQHSQHIDSSGLGISCDPSILGGNYNSEALPSSVYNSMPLPASPYHVSPVPHGLPDTARRQQKQRGSPTRSPSPPATESRASRKASSSKRGASKHRRTKSASTTPKQSQSQLGKGGGGCRYVGGFVNFTPQDSGKILNGVAPSGSSKTKARREKEAADKRRRLSQAAMRAVIEAGGDVETLQKAGLIG